MRRTGPETMIVLLVLLFWKPCLSAERPLGVCESLRALRLYNGKKVELRGVLVRGRHGWHLDDPAQATSAACVALKKQTWPPSISVVLPQGVEDEDPPVAFEADLTRIQSTLAQFDKGVQHKPRLFITLAGELRSRPRIIVRRRRDGSYDGNGYGQMGMFAAQLVICTVRDASLWAEQ